MLVDVARDAIGSATPGAVMHLGQFLMPKTLSWVRTATMACMILSFAVSIVPQINLNDPDRPDLHCPHSQKSWPSQGIGTDHRDLLGIPAVFGRPGNQPAVPPLVVLLSMSLKTITFLKSG